jgi:hypothetical protein
MPKGVSAVKLSQMLVGDVIFGGSKDKEDVKKSVQEISQKQDFLVGTITYFKCDTRLVCVNVWCWRVGAHLRCMQIMTSKEAIIMFANVSWMF